MKKYIPNIITLFNLLSGLIALIFVFQQDWLWATGFVLLGILFDFFDGLAARKLGVSSALGLQLDSLADMVTSGVVPGFVMYFLLRDALHITSQEDLHISTQQLIPFVGLLVTLGSALRLAKFNIDERQTSSFIGLPTPANTLFIVSLPLIAYYQNDFDLKSIIVHPVTLVIISLLSAYMLNAELPLFSLKFKNFNWKQNREKFILIILSIISIPLLKFIAIPVIIIIYILLSLVFKSPEN